jgi:hypothetical protein
VLGETQTIGRKSKPQLANEATYELSAIAKGRARPLGPGPASDHEFAPVCDAEGWVRCAALGDHHKKGAVRSGFTVFTAQSFGD